MAWPDWVFYEVCPRSFRDGSGDGAGGPLGIILHRDYLWETLGVEAIWLSPFYPSPMAGFGCEVADYCEFDPLSGDPAAFDRLPAGAGAWTRTKGPSSRRRRARRTRLRSGPGAPLRPEGGAP